MTEKQKRVKTSIHFTKGIYDEAKKLAIDKHMKISAFIESLILKAIYENKEMELKKELGINEEDD